jgi:hypothetical protein
MWWNKPKTPKAPEKSRYEQLIEARDKLAQQIETLKMFPKNTRVPTGTPALIAELSTMLQQIEEEELADEPPEEDSK